MKLASILAALLFAGCLSNAATDAPAPDVTAGATPPLPFLAEGRLFLPPSSGNDRVETLIPFAVNASGMQLVADLALGSTYGPIGAPVTIADVLVEIRAPDGTALAEGALGVQETEARLEASANETGEHALAILSYGGSDESANGDHVDWRVETVLGIS